MTRKASFHWAWIILATCFVNLWLPYRPLWGPLCYYNLHLHPRRWCFSDGNNGIGLDGMPLLCHCGPWRHRHVDAYHYRSSTVVRPKPQRLILGHTFNWLWTRLCHHGVSFSLDRTSLQLALFLVFFGDWSIVDGRGKRPVTEKRS